MRMMGFAAVSEGPGNAGIIASSNGSANVAPTPFNNFLRGIDFLKTIIALVSSSSETVRY